MEKPELTVNDIQSGWNTGDKQRDLEMINAVLSGNYTLKTDEPAQSVQPVEPQQSAESTVDPQVEQIVEPTVEPIPTVEIDELERQRRYNEMLEKRLQEERENMLRDIKTREMELEKEKKAREELSKKLQELSVLQNERPSTVTGESVEEDEEYLSDYAKKTRKMIEELRESVGSNNPVIQELNEKINTIYTKIEQEESDRVKRERERAQRDAEQKLFDNIREFQNKYPELKTSKDIKEIEQDYYKFRRDVCFATGAKTPFEVDKAIEDAYRGGATKQVLDQNGISFPVDYDKYQTIVELNDLKRGVMYDPILGKEVNILDENGEKVNYRSLEETYRVKHFYDEINRVKKETYKEVNKKLEKINDAPVQLEPTQTSTLQTGLTAEAEREILNMRPQDYMRDPEKFKLVELVYAKHGLDVPRWRGRKITR